MTIRELYNDSVLYDQPSLTLLLDFLIFEKEVLTFKDDASALQLYFKPKHAERMNKELRAYKEKRNKRQVS